ncbi:MAG: peroxiredoxin [Sphingopyxis sp.]
MIGQTVPDICLKTRVRDESLGGDNPFRWQDVMTGELFGTGRHVVFSLPGAFTPTCSNSQLPGFEGLFGEFQAAGVAGIHCVSVNDAFVMYQWGKAQGVQNVSLLPDGSGNFTRRMGMLINKDHLGFGMRSWRYAMVIDDGKIVQMFVEPGCNDCGSDADPYGETAPEPILAWVKANPRAA